MGMKQASQERYRENNRIIAAMESHDGFKTRVKEGATEEDVILRKGPELPLGTKYTLNAPFKFGGKKRGQSNSGGMGRAGRRAKRFGKRH